MAHPRQLQAQKTKRKSQGEGSPADRRQDAALAKKTGKTMAQVERSAADRRADKARETRRGR